MGLFSRRDSRERQEAKCQKLTRQMVDSFGDVCSMMTLDSFCRVISVLVERYRLENDVTVGQLRYMIEQTYSQMTTVTQ